MKFSNPILSLAGLFGFMAVALSAYAHHHLRISLEENLYLSVQTAIQFQLFHAVVMVALSFVKYTNVSATLMKRLSLSAYLFVAGIVLFCLSIYAFAYTGNGIFVKFTPLGGVSFMAGWVLILCAPIHFKKSSDL